MGSDGEPDLGLDQGLLTCAVSEKHDGKAMYRRAESSVVETVERHRPFGCGCSRLLTPSIADYSQSSCDNRGGKIQTQRCFCLIVSPSSSNVCLAILKLLHRWITRPLPFHMSLVDVGTRFPHMLLKSGGIILTKFEVARLPTAITIVVGIWSLDHILPRTETTC
ncbi:hypothetical protein Pmar_PMAR000560 [Perkinsus marinus ATCC 50983]|uniref:Uncharacterized protein n=1 Tax=Perkinsus marinus (strain ATCC 50983 / TXsc) TaxID=423536 RepID=C5LIY8_PERM5|nr:hypothetical protein Pmar_PMAR000560 [Perkinsus marinus ATCC 50983]EER03323.1 hypothetical protein Pmar_PMAR000560 [Perkinsus marinus ATCC 50983]|eukprot:XP_002771507.1 hypothetical protein Pmar_PMAR000560 [Perkinsus marinus ATCC 50983]